jgi:cytohesin
MKTIHSYSLSLARSFFCTFAARHVAFLLLLTMATASAVTIHDAAKAGDAEAVRAILQTNAAAVLLTNRFGETALHLGAGAASPAVVEVLLAAKAPVNAQARGSSALQAAIVYGRLKSWAERFAHRDPNFQELADSAWRVIANPEIRTVGEAAFPMGLKVLRQEFLAVKVDPERTRAELKVVELLLTAGADVKLADLAGFTALHCAAMRPEPEFVQALLSNGADVLAQTRTGDTPLHFAASLGSPASVELLLKKGAKVGKVNRFGNSPLFLSAAGGKLEIAGLLLKHGAFADDINHDGNTPLYEAVQLGNREMVTLLLDEGHVPMSGRMGKLGETALHVAAHHGDADMVRFLLDRKADPNATDKEGFTPLLNAAEQGELATVEILAQNGADLTARTPKDSCAFALAAGSTNLALVQWLAEKLPSIDSKDKVFALQSACLHGCVANVRWLLGQGVPANATNLAGTPLLSACGGPGMIARLRQQKDPALKTPGDGAGPEEDYAQIVSLLLTNGADVNFVGPKGRTPLHNATTCGSVLITEILLRCKADINARTRDGKTPLHQAAAWGDARLIELLLTNRAAIEAKDNYGFTPLRDAAAQGNEAAIKVLLAHGAVVSVLDTYGATPLHWVAMTTNVAAASLLLDAGAAVNTVDLGKRTPLHQAAASGQAAMVQLLVEQKADTNLKDAGLDTPADLARKKGYFHIETILQRQAPPPPKPSGDGSSQ